MKNNLNNTYHNGGYITSDCGCDKLPEKCECTSTVDSKCVVYNSRLLEVLNVKEGDNLEYIIQQMNTLLLDIQNTMKTLVKLKNVGTGEQIFKGVNASGEQEIKSLTKGNGIKLTRGADDITVAVDDTYISNAIPKTNLENVGGGRILYKGDRVVNGVTLKQLKSLVESPSIDLNANDNEISFKVNEQWLTSKIPVPPVVTIENLTYSNTNATSCNVGGIPAGTRFDNVPLKQLLDQMLYNCKPE